jgi:hypothetical protein
MISPDTVPGAHDFSRLPNPKLVATYRTPPGEAIAIGRRLDRDHIVDETGGQTVVFDRRGWRADEARRFRSVPSKAVVLGVCVC